MPRHLRHTVLGLSFVVALFAAKKYVESRITVPSAHGVTLSPEESRIQTLALTRNHFGFRHVISDLLWVRLLQANDHTPVPKNAVSWEYGQLEAIVRLDPHFSRAYSFGAIFLTILRQDRLGAQFILEKWAKRYPQNYRPLMLLGFLHYNDLKDYETGAKYMLKAAQMPFAPQYLSSLGIRLASQSGANAQNLALSIELYDAIPIEESRERLRLRIRDLTYAMQQSAWRDAVTTYKTSQGRLPASLEDVRPLMTQRLVESLVLLPKEVPYEIAVLLRRTYNFRFDPKTGDVVPTEASARDIGQVKIYEGESP